ncbi:unnamed protein product [Cladocopium goreaui]|uniref:C3H1-type domain-containing protein n=1 Tax=Cladocopium goreaui TaxID=2562237 RepID=A0A9P1M5L4_9DINO|nr:unnamed protein product [Cladocopium goreaui]|mmetsp:Transcript_47258/g.103043  ORF Transcript_47258/g.103043 Transcript_47258/m.103043 type:complete len:226 (-) Transcript_47258:26-703(-)
MVDAELPLGPLGRLCCNRRARARGEKTSAGAPISSTATPCTEAEPVQSTSDAPDDGSDASKEVPHSESSCPDERHLGPTTGAAAGAHGPPNGSAEGVEETGSSGYFSNSTSSESDMSDPCFWKPQRIQSDSSAASATSSEFRQAEAEKKALEELMGKVPVTDFGEPTSLGSMNHPVSCSPCMFFAKPSGCIRGLQCEFCHFPHQAAARRPGQQPRTTSTGKGISK